MVLPSKAKAQRPNNTTTRTQPRTLPPIEPITTDTKITEDPAPKSDPRMKPGVMAKKLSDIYGSVGMLLYPFDASCATVVMSNAEAMANSLEALARENSAVKRVLEKLLVSNAVMGVVAAHFPVLMAIGLHHIPALQRVTLPMMPRTEEPSAND